jgi:hypothetical protein
VTDRENELESTFRRRLEAEVQDVTPTETFVDSVIAAHVRRKRRIRARWGAIVGACAVAAAAIVPTVELGSVAAGAHREMNGGIAHVLGHKVRLPSGYHLMSDTSMSCQAWTQELSTQGATAFTGTIPGATDEIAVPAAREVQNTLTSVLSSGDGNQACLQATVSPPYPLPTGTTATSPLIAATWSLPTTTTTIDGFFAESTAIEVHESPASTPKGDSGTGGTVPTQTLTGSVLYVRVPASGGDFRLVTLTSYELDQSVLTQLAAEALSQPIGG